MDMRKLSENRVTVASSTTIPLRCVVNVKCKVEQASVVGGMTGVLEPEQRFEERYSLRIIKVVATVKEGGVPVRLFHPNHKPARIYRGSTVGKLCPAQDPGEGEDLTEPQPCYHICPSSCEPKSKGGSSSTMISQEDNQKRKEAMAEMFEIDNPNLSTEEKETVYEILSRHSAVISSGKTDLGKLKTIQHTINTGESSPIRVPTRRLPYHRMEEARREIEAMLASDVIEESDSPWSAPVVMVSMMSWKPFQVQLSLLTWTLSVVTGKSEWMKEIERNGILYSRRSLPI